MKFWHFLSSRAPLVQRSRGGWKTFGAYRVSRAWVAILANRPLRCTRRAQRSRFGGESSLSKPRVPHHLAAGAWSTFFESAESFAVLLDRTHAELNKISQHYVPLQGARRRAMVTVVPMMAQQPMMMAQQPVMMAQPMRTVNPAAALLGATAGADTVNQSILARNAGEFPSGRASHNRAVSITDRAVCSASTAMRFGNYN